jgi:hypothetical protein
MKLFVLLTALLAAGSARALSCRGLVVLGTALAPSVKQRGWKS